jgi:hypothetical protein
MVQTIRGGWSWGAGARADGGCARAATVGEEGGAVEFTASMWRRRQSSGTVGDASRHWLRPSLDRS